MNKRAGLWRIALVLAMASMVCLAGGAAAQEGSGNDAMALFKKGITHYKSGEFAEAKDAFDQMLALNPDRALALAMRDHAELGLFLKMAEREELAPQARKIATLLLKASREGKRDIADKIDKLLEDLQSEEVIVQGAARVTLKSHGPFAVPYLTPFLLEDDPAKQSVVGMTVSLLASMHRDASLPLVEFMVATDVPLAKTRAAAALRFLRDIRSLPGLMGVWQDKELGEVTRRAAADTIQAISGKTPGELGSAVQQYAVLGDDYFREDGERVGFTYGFDGAIWTWDADTKKVVYRLVPNYLYYQTMALETAKEGLVGAPGNVPLQELAMASLARLQAHCDYVASDEALLGGKPVADDVKTDAAERAAGFAERIPVLSALLEPSVIGDALEKTLDVGDADAAVVLLDALDAKLAGTAPVAPDAATIESLMAALNTPDKNVRYRAAITFVKTCPHGDAGNPDPIVSVIGKVVRAASARNALVIMDHLQHRNSVVAMLKSLGIGSVEAGMHKGQVAEALAIQPSVDVILVSVNTQQNFMDAVMAFLKEDFRTKGLPMHAVLDPQDEAVQLAGVPVTGLPNLTAEKLGVALGDVLVESKSPLTEEEAALVLTAAQGVSKVRVETTKYPVELLEASFISALSIGNEEVSTAVIDCLGDFGTFGSVAPLSGIVAGDGSIALKVAACDGIAAILKRTQKSARDDVVAVLKNALAVSDVGLRSAAAGALSVAGLSDAELLALKMGELQE